MIQDRFCLKLNFMVYMIDYAQSYDPSQISPTFDSMIIARLHLRLYPILYPSNESNPSVRGNLSGGNLSLSHLSENLFVREPFVRKFICPPIFFSKGKLILRIRDDFSFLTLFLDFLT